MLPQACRPIITVKVPLCEALAKGHCARMGAPESELICRAPSGCYKVSPHFNFSFPLLLLPWLRDELNPSLARLLNAQLSGTPGHLPLLTTPGEDTRLPSLLGKFLAKEITRNYSK